MEQRSAVPGESKPGRADGMELIRSVQRACDLLTAFTAVEPRLALSDLSARVGLPKPTTYRLASTLVDAGFMTQHADGRYGLGVRLIEVGSLAHADLDLIEVCAPVMDRLAAQSRETVLLGVIDWTTLEITIVHRIDSPHELSVVSPVGRRSALAPGALGKALLMGLPSGELESLVSRVDLSPHTERTIGDARALVAEISRCSERGYATDTGEFIEGVSAVAVPVWLLGRGGSDEVPLVGGALAPTAAVAVVGPSTRVEQRLAELGPALSEAVANLTGRNQAAPRHAR